MVIEEDDDDSEEERIVELEPEPALSAKAAAALRKADTTRAKGNAAFKEGQYEVASEHYSSALDQLAGREHTDEKELAVKCLNNRAACSCQLQQYRAAVRDCSEVLELSPKDAKALMRRGFAYESIERYAEALADMRAVQSIEPSAQASAACIRLSKFAAKHEALDGNKGKAAPAAAKETAAKEAAKKKEAEAKAAAKKKEAEAKAAEAKKEAEAKAEAAKRAEVAKKVEAAKKEQAKKEAEAKAAAAKKEAEAKAAAAKKEAATPTGAMKKMVMKILVQFP